MDKEIETYKKTMAEKKVDLVARPEMPAKISEPEYLGTQAPTPKPKPRVRWTDALAVDFSLPRW